MSALVLLLTSWVPFALLLPFVRRRELSRAFWLPAALGLAAAAYCGLTFWLWPEANIRVDLVALFAVVWMVDLGAVLLLAAALMGASGRRLPKSTRRVGVSAALVAALLLLVSGAEWAMTTLEMRRASARFDRGRQLLLEAKLRDSHNARLAYGSLQSDDPALATWVGVWDLEPGSRFRTLIVTGESEVWLRFDCFEGPCEVGPGTLDVKTAATASVLVPLIGAPDADGWRIELGTDRADRLDVRIEATWPDARGEPVETMARRLELPPPTPRRSEIEALGTFSALVPIRNHVALTEVRLWRDGDELLAVYIGHVALPGRSTILMPEVVTGIRAGDDGTFELDTSDGRLRASFVDQALELVDGQSVSGSGPLVLERRERVLDPALRLIPTASRAAWNEWVAAAIPPIVHWEVPHLEVHGPTSSQDDIAPSADAERRATTG